LSKSEMLNCKMSDLENFNDAFVDYLLTRVVGCQAGSVLLKDLWNVDIFGDFINILEFHIFWLRHYVEFCATLTDVCEIIQGLFTEL
jgi:hypothetical protein